MLESVTITNIILIFSFIFALICWILAEHRKSYVLFLITSGAFIVFSIQLMDNVETTQSIALVHVIIWLLGLYLGSVGIYNAVKHKTKG